MLDRKAVEAALAKVTDPELGRSLVDLGMIKDVRIAGDRVAVEIALTTAGCPLRAKIKEDITGALHELPGVGEVAVTMRGMTAEEREALLKQLGKKPTEPPLVTTNAQVIGVASGKGGVGKSTVTVNLAAALAAQGYAVGLLDADIWGFSIPRMLGLHEQPKALDGRIIPLEKYGLKIMSIGFFVPEEQPIVWRGPLVHRAIEQFLTEVDWGELDFLLIDLPPGTGDVTISVAKLLPRVKLLMVTTPQEAAAKVAVRAGHMAKKSGLEIVGVVENMSYLTCEGCGVRNNLFGQGGGRLLARALDTQLLSELPLEPAVARAGDAGQPVVIGHPDSEVGVAFRRLAASLAPVHVLYHQQVATS